MRRTTKAVASEEDSRKLPAGRDCCEEGWTGWNVVMVAVLSGC